MEENYKTQKVFKDLMKNPEFKRSLGFGESKGREAVLGIMNKEKIIKDPSQLSKSKRMEFLKIINRENKLRSSVKKAFNLAYGKNGQSAEKSNVDPAKKTTDRQKIYDEIMQKRKSPTEQIDFKKNTLTSFLVSNKNVRAARGLTDGDAPQASLSNDSRKTKIMDGGNDDVIDTLRRIQS